MYNSFKSGDTVTIYRYGKIDIAELKTERRRNPGRYA